MKLEDIKEEDVVLARQVKGLCENALVETYNEQGTASLFALLSARISDMSRAIQDGYPELPRGPQCYAMLAAMLLYFKESAPDTVSWAAIVMAVVHELSDLDYEDEKTES